MRIQVAIGVVVNKQKKVLITRRCSDAVHGANLWEFPGGKIAERESPSDALKRELKEEVGLTIDEALPFLQSAYDYPERKVLLNVFLVEKFSGEAKCCEKQTALLWVPCYTLENYAFPAGNAAIIVKLKKELSHLSVASIQKY